MDILFLNAQYELRLKKEVNGTMLLATKLLEADFDVDVLRFAQIPAFNKDYESFISQVIQKILEANPRCLSIYSMAREFHIMMRIAREIRTVRPDIILVVGGPHTSGVGDEILRRMEFIDYVCTGEGENTVVPFFTAVLRGGVALDTIPGLWYRCDGEIRTNHIEIPLCDLNTLPRWDVRLLPNNSEPDFGDDMYLMPIDAGRGCPYNCTFCCTSYFWRRMYRLKSPERIMADICYYHDTFGINSFYFSHDAFTINQKLVAQVCDKIIESGMQINWRCTSRVDCLSEELVLKMKQAGMNQIEVGIETGSARMQKLIHKNLDLAKAKKTIAFLLEQGIMVTTFFMYGLPQETEQDINETLEFLFDLVDMGIHGVNMSLCQFTPTTDITQKYFDQLVLSDKVKYLVENVFGYPDEREIIQECKSLFPFYYHLPTKEREDYQYLDFFVDMYYRFPETVQHLRKCYQGDNLRFYWDMIRNNQAVFDGTISQITESCQKDDLQIMMNTTLSVDVPYIEQLRALMRLSYDCREVARMGDGGMMLKNYDFDYSDFLKHLPMEEYSKGNTMLFLQNVGGEVKIRRMQATK